MDMNKLLIFIAVMLLIFGAFWHSDAPQADAESRRTNILIGSDAILTGIERKNIAETNGRISIDVSQLENPVNIGGLWLRNSGSILEQSADATTWQPFALQSALTAHVNDAEAHSGGGGGTVIASGNYALQSAAHGNAMATYTGEMLNQFADETLQITALVNKADTLTAERFFSLYSTEYSVTAFAFGVDSTNHPIITYATDSITTTTITSTRTMPIGALTEIAAKLTATGIIFYINGEAEAEITRPAFYSAIIYGSGEYRLYEGFKGIGGAVKIGSVSTWPTTGNKGISTDGLLFPGAFLLFPVNEGTGETIGEFAQGWAFTKDIGATWTQMPGLF